MKKHCDTRISEYQFIKIICDLIFYNVINRIKNIQIKLQNGVCLAFVNQQVMHKYN